MGKSQYFPALIRSLLFMLVPIGIYAAILLIPSPFPFRPLSITIRYSFLVALAGAGLFLYLLFNLRGYKGAMLSASGTLALFALGLLGLWVSGQSTSTVLGSLLPLYDANHYYLDAQRLLAGSGFLQFSSWRPMFPGLLSLVLALTGNHLQLTLAILGIIPAFACFFFARQVQRSYGPPAAVVILLILFFYYRQRVSGMVMSEHLGLAFGALALALMWAGAEYKNRALFVLGVLLMGLGQNTRPGTLLVLPASMLWGGWWFRGEKNFSWSTFLYSGLAVAASFLVNGLILRLVAMEPSMPFANFALTLYGLVNGGRSFAAAATDHPELTALQGAEAYRYIYRLTLEAFLRNPFGIVQGALAEWSRFLSNTGYSVFSCMAAESPLVTLAARLSLYGLSIIGLLRSLLRWREKHHSLVLALFAGVFLSVPFVPPGDAYGMRLYAATMPVIALLPALGFSFLLEKMFARLSWLWYRPAPDLSSWSKNPAALYSICLAAITVLAPFFVKFALNRPAVISAQTCPADLEALYVRLHPGSYVNVRPEGEFFLDRLPDFHQGRFSKQVHGMPDTQMAQLFDHLQTPITIYRVIDVTSFEDAWLLVDSAKLTLREGLFQMCGRWDTRPEASSYRMFFPEEVRWIDEVETE